MTKNRGNRLTVNRFKKKLLRYEGGRARNLLGFGGDNAKCDELLSIGQHPRTKVVSYLTEEYL